MKIKFRKSVDFFGFDFTLITASNILDKYIHNNIKCTDRDDIHVFFWVNEENRC